MIESVKICTDKEKKEILFFQCLTFDGYSIILPIKNYDDYTKEERYLAEQISNVLIRYRRCRVFYHPTHPYYKIWTKPINEINWFSPLLTKDKAGFYEENLLEFRSSIEVPKKQISIREFYKRRKKSSVNFIMKLTDDKWVVNDGGKFYIIDDGWRNNHYTHFYVEILKFMAEKIVLDPSNYIILKEIFRKSDPSFYGRINLYTIEDNFKKYPVKRFVQGNISAIKAWAAKIYIESNFIHNISFREFINNCLDMSQKGHKYRQSIISRWLNLKKKWEKILEETLKSDDHSDIIVVPENLISEDVHGGMECAQDIQDAPEREEASSSSENNGDSMDNDGDKCSDGDPEDNILNDIETLISFMKIGGGASTMDYENNPYVDDVSKELKKLFEKLVNESSPYGRNEGGEFWDTKKLIKAKYNPEFFTPRSKSEREKETNIYLFLDNSGSMSNLTSLFKGLLEYSKKYVNVFTGSEAHPVEGIYNNKEYKTKYIHCFEDQIEEFLKIVKPQPGSIFIFWGDTCDMGIEDPKRLKQLLRRYKCYWLGVYCFNNYYGWEQPKLKESDFKVIAPVTNTKQLLHAIKKIRV